MANQQGFKFEIRGEVFITQKSKAGADVVAAFNEAAAIREKIQAELLDIAAAFKIGEPVAASRRMAEIPATTGATEPPDPSDEDGPTPALDLPSRSADKK